MRHESSLPPLGAGHRLADRFDVLGVLGEGATGIVYDAQRVIEGDRVALKVIHPHLAGDPQIRGRFVREAAILRRLEGQHLRPVLEFGELPDPRRPEAGLVYMALPRVEGPALDALLRREGRLPIARAVAVVLDVCEALTEAHAQGVIHRDLKPGNVLVEEGDRAVVVDFGMAKIMTGSGTGTTALTQHNVIFGTPEYMSPEQARGDELDARCDVYAAGVILYELLTGSVPFRGATPLSILTAHLTAPPQPPRERAPDRGVSPALEAAVLHALAKDPRDRYANASAFATAVCHALASPRDVAAVRPSPLHDAATRAEPAQAHEPAAPVQPSASRSAIVRPTTRARTRTWLFIAAVLVVGLGGWLAAAAGR